MHGRRGSFAMASALLMSLVFGVGMFTFEATRIDRARSGLQDAADAAAMAAAKELPVIGGSIPAMRSVARSVAEVNLGMAVSERSPRSGGQPGIVMAASAAMAGDQGGGGSGGRGRGRGRPQNGEELQVDVSRGEDGKSVRVELRRNTPMVFGSMVNVSDPWVIASATAEVFGETRICIIALKPGEIDGIKMEDKARISGDDCGVYVNSRHFLSLHLHDDSHIDSTMICIGGGYEGKDKNYSSKPITDCPQIGNPLAYRRVPAKQTCDHSGRFTVSGTTVSGTGSGETRSVDGVSSWVVLKPGAYCGGLEIQDGSDVWFDPGTYVIRDGPLSFLGNSRIRGENVSFHFAGSDAYFEILDEAEVKLSAPETGRLAGILFYEHASAAGCAGTIASADGTERTSATATTGTSSGCDPAVEHVIKSPNVKELLGTIYVPDDRLLIETDKKVADESAFTVLIVSDLKMLGKPNLVLNTDYEATRVPVPDGMIQQLDQVRLHR